MGYKYDGDTLYGEENDTLIAHDLAKILNLTPKDTISETLAQKTDIWPNWEVNMEDISKKFPSEVIHIYNSKDNIDGYFYHGNCVTYIHEQERMRFEDLV